MAGSIDAMEAEWSRICRRLEATGLKALRHRGVETEREKAEALRLVVREFRSAAEKYVEAADPAFPVIVRADETSSGPLAAPNIDNWYLYIPLSAAHTYRITGNLSSVFDVIFAPHDEKFGNFGELYGQDMQVAANGEYELFLGGPRRDGNWMPLAEGVTFITVRFYYYDWEKHSPPPIRIERVGSLGEAPEPIMPRPLAARLDRAIDYVDGVPYTFSGLIEGWVRDLAVNTISRPHRIGGSSQAIQYGTGIVELAEDEALIVETTVPDARYWGFHLYTYPWFELIDVSRRVTALNGNQVHVDADGKVRLVVAHRDPGAQNWLDAASERRVFFFFRWIWANDGPQPVARKVKLAEVRKALPPGTPGFGRKQREAQIEMRRKHLALRFRY